jgi:hypothetical protein
LADGDVVIIEGTTSYNGTFTIEHTVAGAFEIVKLFVANDATGTVRGPGANTVTVYYLDNTFAEKSSTVTLLGTTPVNIAADMYRVQNARVASVGNSHVPIGFITIASSGNTYGYISVGKTRMRQMVWSVPKDKTLYVTDITFSCADQTASKYARFTTRATYDDKSGSLLYNSLFMPYHEILLNNGSFYKILNPPTKLPEYTDIKVSAYANSAAAVSCALRGYLVSA